jgi:biotin-dependent carboxylase-like uncharacterized protein
VIGVIQRSRSNGAAPGRAVTVLRAGPLAVVTDLGRPGLAHLGVPRSGALDLPALRLANRLVGNAEDTAGLELLFGGLALRAEQPMVVAVSGAPVPVFARTRTQRRAVGSHRAVFLAEGDELELGEPVFGARSYLGLSGGVAVPEVLGSRGTDLLSGLGPEPLRDGDRLPLGAPQGDPPACEPIVPVSAPPPWLSVPVLLGPRDDWFDEPARALRSGEWTVSSTSNRIGLRLSGSTVRRTREREGAELPSEPMLPGAMQVPPSGEPVIFLADGPTTGGYPVIGVVPAVVLPLLAQLRPGAPLRFVPSTLGPDVPASLDDDWY